MDDNAYCAARVRALDSDRYLTALFAPPALCTDLLALYAFNSELARSREAVSDPALGQIRLQWWRDAIAECYEGEPRRHQVVQPLAAAIGRHDLPRHLFDRIIDAREADFDPAPPEWLEDLLTYAAATSGALSMLALRILGERDQELERAASAVGTACGQRPVHPGVVSPASGEGGSLPLVAAGTDSARRRGAGHIVRAGAPDRRSTAGRRWTDRD